MTSCPFGKASLCFPLQISRAAVLGALNKKDGGIIEHSSKVVGYTTQKTLESGAASIRVALVGDSSQMETGAALLVAVRANGYEGFLPGIAAPRCGGKLIDGSGLEIVIFGRCDKNWEEVMYLPEDVLQELFPEGTSADVRVLMPLAPVQHDCPPQWLRDRLLRLADGLNDTYAVAAQDVSSDDLQNVIKSAGVLTPPPRISMNPWANEAARVPPADTGKNARKSEEELGVWTEESQMNARCGADAPTTPNQAWSSFPGIEAML